MAHVDIHLLVEPFKENDPGPHVLAAIEALTDAGLDPDMGPFASTASGAVDAAITGISDAIGRAIALGASSLQIRVDVRR